MKKILSVILSVVMIVISVPVTAFAVTYETEGYFTYYVNNNNRAVLTAVDQSLTGNITIPDTLGGYPVVSIGPDTFRDRKNITGVKLPYSLSSISNGAFFYCVDLVSIRIPDSVKTIYDITFYGCKSLESVYLGKGVTTIGESAFAGCKNLKNITVTDNLRAVGEESFYGCLDMTVIIEINDMKSWCENDSIPSIYIPSEGIPIGDREAIPPKIISINDEYVTEIVIPEGTKKIRNNAFNNCIEVADITIPDSVESIGYDAFYNTAYYNNKSNWDSAGVLYIDNHIIKAKETVAGEYTAKNGTVTVAASAFSNCDKLTAVALPDSLKGIGDSAFYSTTKLSSITLPDKPLRIESYAFHHSSYYVNSDNRENNALYIGNHLIKLFGTNENIVVKEGTFSIAGHAFYDDKPRNHKSVVIPASVKIIEKNAFYSNSLQDVYYGGTREDLADMIIEESSYANKSPRMHFNTTSAENHFICTPITNPTCTTDGTGEFTCPCGYIYTGVIPGGHDYVYHDGTAPTCTEDGFAPYTTCTKCDYSTYTVLPGGHDTVFNPGKAPTCTEPGYSSYATCTRCDYSTYKESPPLGHDTVQHTGKAPTCTEPGFEPYETCTKCDHSTYKAIPAKEHECIQHPAQVPGCTEIGWDPYEACINCTYNTYVELPAHGHTYENGACIYCGEDGPATVSPGDVNDNGSINLSDVTLLLQYVAKWNVTLSPAAADVTGDGEVNLSDVTRLLQYIAKWDVTLG